MNQINDWKMPNPYRMMFAATTPNTANGTKATIQSSTRIRSSKLTTTRSIKT